MKTKLSIVAATLLLGGCGSALDLSTGPMDIAQTQGIEAAKQWCKDRQMLKAEVGALHTIGGALFDLAVVPISAAEAVVGSTVLEGTSYIRDKQCATLNQ